MNQEFDDELSEEERQVFAGLPREKVPPARLEDRVVQSLKQAGVLSPPKKFIRSNAVRIGMAVAASLLFFVLGAAVMRWWSRPVQTSDLPEFMLVLRQTRAQDQQRTAEESLRIAKEYGNWARQLSRQGVPVDGEKLKDEARTLRMVDGRPTGSDEINRADAGRATIAGYFLIKATGYEHAVKIAEGCPHLKYGGTIEVREIDRF